MVTGASSGIGEATALALNRDGYHVIGLARRENKLATIRDECDDPDRYDYHTVDLTDESDRERVLTDECPDKLNVLVNNAGICQQAPYTDEDTWNAVMGINLDATYQVTRLLGPRIEDGSIVNVSSGLGKNGRGNYAAYCTSKHGVIGLTKSLARELAPDVRVNAVCPGWVDTSMARGDVKTHASEQGVSAEEMREQFEEEIPLERFVEPWEVAELIAFLTGERAGAITGQTYNISCGEL